MGWEYSLVGEEKLLIHIWKTYMMEIFTNIWYTISNMQLIQAITPKRRFEVKE